MTEVAAPAAGGQGAEPASSAALLAAPPPAAVAPAAAQTSVAVAPPAAAAPTSAIPWLGEGIDDLTAGYVQNKGWKGAPDVVESYKNLEKMLGADRAGNTVILPKDGASPEEVGKFYDRLGRPADPTGYKLAVPDGAPKDFADGAAKFMHEQGLTQKQGEALGKWWNDQAAAAQSAHQQQKLDNFNNDEASIRREQGAAHAQYVANAQAAVRGLGLDDASINKLQDALGHKGTMDLLARIGAKTGEPDFATSGTQQGFSGALSPAAAKAKIQELTSDKGFIAKYLNKDSAAVAEMTRLHQWAYGGER